MTALDFRFADDDGETAALRESDRGRGRLSASRTLAAMALREALGAAGPHLFAAPGTAVVVTCPTRHGSSPSRRPARTRASRPCLPAAESPAWRIGPTAATPRCAPSCRLAEACSASRRTRGATCHRPWSPAPTCASRYRRRRGPLALHRRGWRHALVDPAAAVGLGVELVTLDRVSGPAADLVFSALLAHAREGDRAAALVLGHALARRVAAARNPQGRPA